MAKKITTTAPAPTPTKKASTKKTVAAAPVVAAPAPTPAPAVVESVAAPIEEEVEEKSVIDTFGVFMKRLQDLSAEFNSIRKEFGVIEKATARELKAAKKASGKRKAKSGNRSPSGFIKPTLVSDELAAFLGKPQGAEMARTEVTREINKYIRANSLQDKDNGRRIIPDAALAKLLKLNKTDELTYFNLQRFMSPHFPKSAKALAAAAAAATTA
jgi:chromatin remodeling complex protein RSC6